MLARYAPADSIYGALPRWPRLESKPAGPLDDAIFGGSFFAPHILRFLFDTPYP